MDNQITSENKKNIVTIIHFLISLLIISSSLFLFNNDGNGIIDVFFYIQIMIIVAGLNFLFGTIIMALTIICKKKGLRLILISEVLTILALFWPSLFDYLTG